MTSDAQNSFEITPAHFAPDVLAKYLRGQGYQVFESDDDLLDELDTEDLVKELESRGKVVTNEEGDDGRVDDLEEAAARFRRGEIADAFHYLERALPADFAGLAQLAPENRP